VTPPSDQLSPAEYSAYRERVFSTLGTAGPAQGQPVAIILAGQPGAGKGGLRDEATKQLASQGGAVAVDPDDCRALHPKYVQWAKENDKTAAARTHTDASRVADDLRDDAIAQRKNLVIDGTLKNPEKAAQLVADLKSKGYRVEVQTLAVDSQTSWKSVQDRYQQQKAQQGFGRWVPGAVHDAAVKGMPTSVMAIEKQGLADSLKVVSRDGSTLHDSVPSSPKTPQQLNNDIRQIQQAFISAGGRSPESVGVNPAADAPPPETPPPDSNQSSQGQTTPARLSFVRIGGTPIDSAILECAEVVQELNDHWQCRVDCRQTQDIRIAVEDSLGQPIQVVTYDQQGAQHVLFDGVVQEATIVYESFGSYTARFAGITRSYQLDLTEQEFYFRKQTLSDVASALTGADGLSADVSCQLKPAKNYVQWGESDFQFLKRMAYEHKAWIRPTQQGIEICDSFQGGSQLAWRQEGSLLEFDMEGQLCPPSFSGTHYNARKMTSTPFQKVQSAPQFSGASGPMVSAVQSSSQSTLPEAYMHVDSRTATPDEYQDALQRESIRSIGSGLTGHGFSQNSALKAGDSVNISGPMDATGTYGLTKVVHHWSRHGYRNEFWCTPWSNYFHPEPLSHRAMPGVVVGRVVDHNDPRKMGRILIQYDWQGGSQTGWARMISPHSGSDRGLMFMPEKGDEVLVGFESGDAERPYIIGALWNGVDSAPGEDFWDGDIPNNDVKRIVTKSGHRIQLSDKQGKESIVISTPNKLKISLLENADETGRSMISLYSADGDIYFDAPAGRVHFHAASLSHETRPGGGGDSPSASPGSQPPTPSPKTPAKSSARAAAAPASNQLAGGADDANSLTSGEAFKNAGHNLSRMFSHWADGVVNAPPEKYSDGISIGGPPEFRKKVRAQLDDLKTSPSGKAVLDKLDEQGRDGKGVTIHNEPGSPETSADDYENAVPADAALDSVTGKVEVKKKGSGSASEVDYDPDWQVTYPDGQPCLPPQGGLLHELIHATHNGNGTNLSQFDMDDPSGGNSNHEEAQTMGSAPYDETGPYGADSILQPTENSYRSEKGLPSRTSHVGKKGLCPDRPEPMPRTDPPVSTFPSQLV
jgi:type VI secretion system secreted protein VgrG